LKSSVQIYLACWEEDWFWVLAPPLLVAGRDDEVSDRVPQVVGRGHALGKGEGTSAVGRARRETVPHRRLTPNHLSHIFLFQQLVITNINSIKTIFRYNFAHSNVLLASLVEDSEVLLCHVHELVDAHDFPTY